MRQYTPLRGATRALVWLSLRLVVGAGSVGLLFWLAGFFLWLLTLAYADIRPYVPPA